MSVPYDEPIIYIDHLSQVTPRKLTPELLASFPGHRERIGNDTFVCIPGNPLVQQFIQAVEQENYQLAQRYKDQPQPSQFEPILEMTYHAHNIKGLTIDRTGPGVIRRVIEKPRFGTLKIGSGAASECRKSIKGTDILIKSVKAMTYQLTQPVVVVTEKTQFESPNRSDWLKVKLDTSRFDTLEKVFSNLIETIKFEQAHFGVLRLADYLRTVRSTADQLFEEVDSACIQFIKLLDRSKIVKAEQLVSVQLINRNPLIEEFYKKHGSVN